jgi:hypothetical protein
MKNLQHLSILLCNCRREFGMENDTIPLKKNLILEAHSVQIKSLQIRIESDTSQSVVSKVFGNLSFLIADTLEIFMDTFKPPEVLLRTYSGEMVPYGSAISLQIGTDRRSRSNDFPLLTELVKGCKIAHSIHIETSTMDIIHPEDPLEVFDNLRHLSLKNCHKLTEEEAKLLTQKLMDEADPAKGLTSLELISCRQLSEGFLLDLGNEFGKKVNWKVHSPFSFGIS